MTVRCACGCGQPAPIAPRTDTAKGWQRGQPLQFVRGHARKHGHRTGGTASPTYQSWRAMLTRCTNPRAARYADYGGRSIEVCDRWRAFAAFLEDLGHRPDGTTLHRPDSASGYTCGRCPDCHEHGRPRNARWATPAEQAAERAGEQDRRARTVRRATIALEARLAGATWHDAAQLAGYAAAPPAMDAIRRQLGADAYEAACAIGGARRRSAGRFS